MDVRGSTRAGWLAVGLWCAATAAMPSLGQAHPAVQAGRAQLEQADFQAAILALQRAESATDLSKADLVELLEIRALAYLGLGDSASVEQDLLRIATIDPRHSFGRDAPPEVAESFARIVARQPGRIVVRVDVDASAGRVGLSGRVDGDPGELVRQVRVSGRVGTASAWQRSANRPLVLMGPPGAVASYYAEALGPGGAVLATLASPQQPLATSVPRGASSPAPVGSVSSAEDSREREPRRSGAPWGWIIGGGLAAIAVAAVVTAVAVSSSSEESGTLASAPVVEGF